MKEGPYLGTVRLLFEEWLKRRHCVHMFHLMQVITGNDYFVMFVFRTRRDEKPGCYHCVDCPRLSSPLTPGRSRPGRGPRLEAMVRGSAETWETVTSFCEAVMLAKEEAFS